MGNNKNATSSENEAQVIKDYGKLLEIKSLDIKANGKNRIQYANLRIATPKSSPDKPYYTGKLSFWNDVWKDPKTGGMSIPLKDAVEKADEKTTYTFLYSTGFNSEFEQAIKHLDECGRDWFRKNLKTLFPKCKSSEIDTKVKMNYKSCITNLPDDDDSKERIEQREKYGLSFKLKVPSYLKFDNKGFVCSTDDNGNRHFHPFLRVNDDGLSEMSLLELEKPKPCRYMIKFDLFTISDSNFGSRLVIDLCRVPKANHKKIDMRKMAQEGFSDDEGCYDEKPEEQEEPEDAPEDPNSENESEKADVESESEDSQDGQDVQNVPEESEEESEDEPPPKKKAGRKSKK